MKHRSGFVLAAHTQIRRDHHHPVLVVPATLATRVQWDTVNVLGKELVAVIRTIRVFTEILPSMITTQ
jgi:hypothetical protein